MAQKTYKQIEQEANQKFGKGASKEKFEWRRSQQEAAGLSQEKRKRGGAARAWDVGKDWMVPAASGLAAILTGGASAPIAASLTGAALRGADTRTLKGALGGAAEGYASGLGASAIKGAATGAMGGGGFAGAGRGAMQGARGYVTPKGTGTTTGAVDATEQGAYDRMMANAGGGAGGASGGGRMSQMLGAVGRNAAVVGPALTAGAEVLGQRGEQEVAMRRLDIEEQLRKEEQARRDRLAQLLMPMFQSQVQQYGQRPQG